MLCPVSSLRGVAFLGAATPPTHSPVAAAYIRVLRDDRTDRIESRMIDLNPVTKTNTKHACVPPTHHSPVTGSRSGGPWPSWPGPPSLPRIASDRSRRVSHHLSGKTERRLGQRTEVCDGWRNVFMYSRRGPGCGPTRVGDSPSPPFCGAAFSSVARISAMLLNLPCGG